MIQSIQTLGHAGHSHVIEMGALVRDPMVWGACGVVLLAVVGGLLAGRRAMRRRNQVKASAASVVR